MLPKSIPFRKTVSGFLALALFSGLSACGGPSEPGGIYDPFEQANRARHEQMKRVDRAVLRPLAIDYVTTLSPVQQKAVSNFALNASMPGIVVNNLLQFRMDHALANTVRFAVNTTAGLGGIADVASTIGIPPQETDFGATLAYWNVPEGAFLSLPVIGPSTVRDATGGVVDLFLNPLRYVIPAPERYVTTVAKVGDVLGTRGRFADTVDSVLYESADSYAALRSAYLQRRRYELGGDAAAGDAYLDPYGSSDVYTDPYLE
ncbi:hypothetical protein ATO6_05900 [Oceanicola sp. 22II-s10i]|uniref:MlaA family lipoprotein n=1 Tax=Oceanicola sp. 22II-s10i TaxID=1317116 RepID=UPI000B522EE2|nr:VacJ family lipoprotein [Oceanicola sp. 22II-s10i]OWU86352.1 hypothetical protein ATO6_05900 [Oceanicola sp. 22II-s10i]